MKGTRHGPRYKKLKTQAGLTSCFLDTTVRTQLNQLQWTVREAIENAIEWAEMGGMHTIKRKLAHQAMIIEKFRKELEFTQQICKCKEWKYNEYRN